MREILRIVLLIVGLLFSRGGEVETTTLDSPLPTPVVTATSTPVTSTPAPTLPAMHITVVANTPGPTSTPAPTYAATLMVQSMEATVEVTVKAVGVGRGLRPTTQP